MEGTIGFQVEIFPIQLMVAVGYFISTLRAILCETNAVNVRRPRLVVTATPNAQHPFYLSHTFDHPNWLTH